MKLSSAKVLIQDLDAFEKRMKLLNLEKIDNYRDGLYTVALVELQKIKDGDIHLDVLMEPDNILRNIIMLSKIDITNTTFRLS